MNFIYKKTIALSIFAIICFTHNNIMSESLPIITSDNVFSPLTATFEIKSIPYLKNPDSNKYYTAVITVTNNSPINISNGWQLDFDFSSNDQTIYKITNGKIIPTSNNHICIQNITAHQRIDRKYYFDSITGLRKKVSSSTNPRMVYLLVNKQPDSTPAIPTVTATILPS